MVFRRSRSGLSGFPRSKSTFLLFVVGALVAFVTQWFNGPKENADPADRTTTESTIRGKATIVDGDTIRIDGRRIRLYGIDAPETDQHCRDAKGQRFACGGMVAAKLAEKIGRQSVDCARKAIDQYQRVMAVCRLPSGENLNDWLVESGFAMAYHHQDGKDYLDRQALAKAEKAGLWAGSFEAPWQWRKRRK